MASIAAQVEILAEATLFLEETTSFIEKSLGDEEEVQSAFIWRHARNVQEIAFDVVALGRAERLDSIYLLGRPALESLFKLAAAINDADFASAKLISEVREEKRKVQKWRASALPAWASTLETLEEDLGDFECELVSKYGEPKKECKIWEVARLAKMNPQYVKDYFLGSKHVHGMVSALTVREQSPALYKGEAVFRLTSFVIEANELVIRYFTLEPIERLDMLLRLVQKANEAKR
jgi:hypothetical protein